MDDVHLAAQFHLGIFHIAAVFAHALEIETDCPRFTLTDGLKQLAFGQVQLELPLLFHQLGQPGAVSDAILHRPLRPADHRRGSGSQSAALGEGRGELILGDTVGRSQFWSRLRFRFVAHRLPP